MYDRDRNWQGLSDDFMGSCPLNIKSVSTTPSASALQSFDSRSTEPGNRYLILSKLRKKSKIKSPKKNSVQAFDNDITVRSNVGLKVG